MTDKWVTVQAAEDVTEEVYDAAKEIVDGWYPSGRIDWTDFLGRIEGMELIGGGRLDFGSDMGSHRPSWRYRDTSMPTAAQTRDEDRGESCAKNQQPSKWAYGHHTDLVTSITICYVWTMPLALLHRKCVPLSLKKMGGGR